MLIKVKHKRVVKHLISFQLDRNQIADVSLVAECPGGGEGEGKCHSEKCFICSCFVGQVQYRWQDTWGIHSNRVHSLPANL